MRPITDWLPITKDEILKRGWSEVDIVIVSGDAYVDHPSFGTAVIGRVLEHEGYKVAILRNRIGKTTFATSKNSENRACFLVLRPAVWIRW